MIAALLTILVTAEPTGTIAYTGVSTDGSSDVYLMDIAADTTDPLGLIGATGTPVWSPDGTQLAVATVNGEGQRIAILNLNSGAIKTAGSDGARAPAWSPNGSRIAYQAGTYESSRIAVYNVGTGEESFWAGGETGLMYPQWLRDGAAMRRFLTALFNVDESTDGPASWFRRSPHRRDLLLSIRYESHAEGPRFDLVLASPKWVEVARHPVLPSRTGEYAEWNVRVSADHDFIVFESNDGGDRELFLMDGRSSMDISNHRAADWNPVWSPDAKWVLFESFRDGSRGLYRVHRETLRTYPIDVRTDAECRSGAWSRDGRWVVYPVDEAGQTDLYLTNAETPNPRPITDDSIVETAVSWRPGADSR